MTVRELIAELGKVPADQLDNTVYFVDYLETPVAYEIEMIDTDRSFYLGQKKIVVLRSL